MEDNELLRVYKKVYDYLNNCNIYEVRNLARAFGVNAPTTDKKKDLILRLIRIGAGISDPGPRSNKGARVKASDASEERVAAVRSLIVDCNEALTYGGSEQPPAEYRFRDAESGAEEFGYGDECATGILEVGKQGHGYLRGYSFMAEEGDAIVSDKLIHQYRLREGDVISAYIVQNGSAAEAVQVAAVNGGAPVFIERKKFDDLPAVYPSERYALGRKDCAFLRAADIVCPLCKGQRGLVFAPSNAGRTIFFREAARSISLAYPKSKLIFVLLDQRPEELTETAGLFPDAAVVAASFEDSPVRAMQAARLALEYAKRIAESGGDAVLLLDSLTALVRVFAYGTVPSGRETAGGIDLAALGAAKKYFAAARKLKGAGSLTMLAAALTGRGVASDADVCEELGGAANMFVRFSREIAACGVIPAIDFSCSYTKWCENFQSERERRCAEALKEMARGRFGAEHIGELFSKTETNEEFIEREELWASARRG